LFPIPSPKPAPTALLNSFVVTAPAKKFTFSNLSSSKVTVSDSSVAEVELIPPLTLLNAYVPALVGRTLHDSVEVVSNNVSTFVLSVLNETLA